MDFELGYIQALAVIGLGFMVFMLGLMIDEVNKKKAIVGYILAVLLVGLGVYSYAVVAQYQRDKGEASFNKLNYFLYIYRPPQQPTSPVQPGPPLPQR
ncbi:MAG TPA: hypothetical protein PKW42_10580 [bacterium]|nr:hypothetical protein [bacterium]